MEVFRDKLANYYGMIFIKLVYLRSNSMVFELSRPRFIEINFILIYRSSVSLGNVHTAILQCFTETTSTYFIILTIALNSVTSIFSYKL